MVEIPMSMVTNAHCSNHLCLRYDLFLAPNPFVERGGNTSPMAQHHGADAGKRIITNPLDEQQELILQREKSALRRSQTKKVI